MNLVLRFVLCIVLLFFYAQNNAQVNVFPLLDSAAIVKINSISIQGNQKTKDNIILREITFSKNDTIQFFEFQQTLDRSQKNIFNTALFVLCNINAIKLPEHQNLYDIIIEVKERFYIIPEPVFELYDRNYKVWRKIYDSDLERIKYGVRLKHFNATGRRDNGRLTLINGFSKEVALSYNRPFIDKKMQHGAGISFSYNKRLGSSYIDSLNAGLPRKLCNDCEEPAFKKFFLSSFTTSFNYQYRKGLYSKHFASLTVSSNSISDSIFFYNKNYFGNQNNKFNYLDIGYSFLYSKVDYFAYPLKGKIVNVGIRNRVGAGKWNQTLFFAKANRYYQIHKNWYAEHSFAASHRFQKPQVGFYNQITHNLFYTNIRGFEQFLILTKSDFVTQNAIRYKLYDKIIKLPVAIRNHEKIPLKIYGRFFVDAAYGVMPNSPPSNLTNRWLSSCGIALDLITVYDYVIKFELSYNQFTKLSFYIR